MIDRPTLAAEIETTLNRYSAEAGSNTPDFILAEYLMQCLKSFNAAVCAREAWYGRGEKAYNVSALRATEG